MKALKAGFDAFCADVKTDVESVKEAEGVVDTIKAVATTKTGTLAMRVLSVMGFSYIACTTTSTLLSVVSVLSVCFITYSMFKKEECSIFDYLDISFVIAMFNSDD